MTTALSVAILVVLLLWLEKRFSWPWQRKDFERAYLVRVEQPLIFNSAQPFPNLGLYDEKPPYRVHVHRSCRLMSYPNKGVSYKDSAGEFETHFEIETIIENSQDELLVAICKERIFNPESREEMIEILIDAAFPYGWTLPRLSESLDKEVKQSPMYRERLKEDVVNLLSGFEIERISEFKRYLTPLNSFYDRRRKLDGQRKFLELTDDERSDLPKNLQRIAKRVLFST